MHFHTQYILPDRYYRQQLINDLADDYIVCQEQSMLKSITYYDTFDWRLFNKSLVLFTSENRLFLRKLFKKKTIHEIAITSSPVFLKDFPDCELKKQLDPVIEMRALIKLVKVNSTLTGHHILNRDKKTVTRLIYEEIRLPQGRKEDLSTACLWLPKIKNSPKDFKQLVERFKELGFTRGKNEDIYFTALKSVKKNPGDYTSKLKIQLHPGMRSDEAARTIFRYLSQIIRMNEIHIKKDLDTGFIHDFRVAVRRTRSALGQIKSVFPRETTRRFKKNLAFVGKLTNRLRDLDVCLLNEEKYKALLPDVLHGDIAPLFEHLTKIRLNAFKEVITQLESTKYLHIMKDWETFINESHTDSPSASNAKIPIVDLAQKRIFTQYQDIIKTGSQILEDMEEEKLHALRIKCKNLRYMMEFTSSLFPKKKIRQLIKQVKKMQRNLGYFNDMHVQINHLKHIAQQLPVADQKSKNTLIATGSLIGTLDGEKQAAKKMFLKIFKAFAASSNIRAFREFFVSKKE